MKKICTSQYAEQDMTQPIMQMLSENLCDAEFVFPKGKYNFYAENAIEEKLFFKGENWVEPYATLTVFDGTTNTKH